MSSSTWAYDSASIASVDHPESCQDSVIATRNTDGDVLLCVADGAGSSLQALKASRKAVEIVDAHFRSQSFGFFDSETTLRSMRHTMAECGSTFTRWIEDIDANIDDYSTTLLIAVISRAWLGIASLGDGFVAGLDESVGVNVFLPPDRPAGALAGAAWMLSDWKDHAQYRSYHAPRLRSLLLSTDGLEKFLRYRPTQGGDGVTRPAVWGVNPFIEALLVDFAAGADSDVLSRLERDDVRTTKGDDIGVAVAGRR